MFVAGSLITPIDDHPTRWRMYAPWGSPRAAAAPLAASYYSPRRSTSPLTVRASTASVAEVGSSARREDSELKKVRALEQQAGETRTAKATTIHFPNRVDVRVSVPCGAFVPADVLPPVPPAVGATEAMAADGGRGSPSLPPRVANISSNLYSDTRWYDPDINQPSRYREDKMPSPPSCGGVLRTLGRQGTDDHRNPIGLNSPPVARALHPARNDSHGAFKVIHNTRANGGHVVEMGSPTMPPHRSLFADIDSPPHVPVPAFRRALGTAAEETWRAGLQAPRLHPEPAPLPVHSSLPRGGVSLAFDSKSVAFRPSAYSAH